MVSHKDVDGENIIYHYFRDELIKRDSNESRLLVRRMIHDLSIWLPMGLFERMPVLLPFVVRDASCRKSVNKKREEWGSCDSNGYFRDDNTLVKAIPRSHRIVSTNRFYAGRRMANGFVACHAWRKLVKSCNLASEHPMTNTFVPNLVWLPRQLSKLTDSEGSFAQRYLQALSISIFKNANLSPKKWKLVRQIWNKLGAPKGIRIGKRENQGLNSFEFSDKDIQNRIDNLLDRIDVIKNRSGPKVYCRRYLRTYRKLPDRTKKSLEFTLSKYVSVIRSTG